MVLGIMRAILAIALFLFPAAGFAAERDVVSPVVFPGTTIALQEGDVVLSQTLSAADMLNQAFGYPTGPYTHVEIFLNVPGKGWKMVGFHASGVIYNEPKAYLARAYHLALVRPRSAPDAGRLTQALATLVKRNLTFDFNMQWPSVDSSSTYCVGLISQIYRLARLPDPFPFRHPRPEDFWSRWSKHALGLDLSKIVSPNAVLSEPDFQLLAEYKSQDPALAKLATIESSIIEKLGDYLNDEKLQFAHPDVGDSLALKMARTGIFGDMLLSRLSPEKQNVFIVYSDFVESVEHRTIRQIRRYNDLPWDKSGVAELTNAIADAYRSKFFEKP